MYAQLKFFFPRLLLLPYKNFPSIRIADAGMRSICVGLVSIVPLELDGSDPARERARKRRSSGVRIDDAGESAAADPDGG